MNLIDLGWNEFFIKEFDKYKNEGFKPARVAQEHKGLYIIFAEDGELKAEITGKLRYKSSSRADFPAVGDWVAVSTFPEQGTAVIHAVLGRQSSFSRKLAGLETDEQILAANISTVFLVSGLDNDFNIRRIERYLSAAWDSGASPVIILNKADLCADIDAAIQKVEEIAIGVPVHAISAAESKGLELISQYLKKGHTIALLGSSGVGKSTIINTLLGEQRQKTLAVRKGDNRGYHATTSRELIVLPEGGIFMDTPGLRLFKIWSGEEGLAQLFEDIEELILQCKFSDCKHESEPGCAVKKALADGSLDSKRYESYLKLQKEKKFLEMQKDYKLIRRSRKEWQKKVLQIVQAREELKKKGLL